MAKYDAVDIANYVVGKCEEDGCPITNLQLQKIMYFLQRQYLKEHGEPLFDNEMQAWQFGPVVPDVYYRFCAFGALPIIRQEKTCEIDAIDLKLIDKIVEEKREKYPWDLVRESHQEGGPWDFVYDDGAGNRNVITPAIILERG